MEKKEDEFIGQGYDLSSPEQAKIFRKKCLQMIKDMEMGHSQYVKESEKRISDIVCEFSSRINALNREKDEINAQYIGLLKDYNQHLLRENTVLKDLQSERSLESKRNK